MSKKNKSHQTPEPKEEPLSSASESEDVTPSSVNPHQESQPKESHSKDEKSVSSSSTKDENKISSEVDAVAQSVSSSVSSSQAKSEKQSAPKQKQTSTPNQTLKQSPKQTGALITVLIVCLLVTIAGAGGLGYFAWQEIQNERQKIAELDERLDKHAQQLMSANQALVSVEKKVQDQKQIFTGYNQQSEQLEAKLSTQLAAYRDQLLTLSTTSNEDWKLAEAYYLTRLAVQRLQMEKSTLGALALLQSADSIVQGQKDPELYRVREALTDDITALQLAGAIDREGIYLQLSSIIKQLENIPSLIPENFQNITEEIKLYSDADTDTDSNAEESDGVVESSFNKAVKHLQSYFRVQHTKDKIDTTLSTQDNDRAKTRLILLLESAQLALLREQAEIYQDSLTKAQDILATYFPKNRPVQTSFQAENLSKLIEEVQGENILQTLPTIYGSQKVLGEYLERLHKIKPVETARVEPNVSLNEEASVEPADSLTQQPEAVGQ